MSLILDPNVQSLVFSAVAAVIGWIAGRRKPAAPAPAPAPAPSPPAAQNPLDMNSDGAVNFQDLVLALQRLLAAKKEDRAMAVLNDLVAKSS